MSQDHSPSRKNEMRFKQTRTRVLVAVTVLALIGFFIWTTDVELSAFHICGPPVIMHFPFFPPFSVHPLCFNDIMLDVGGGRSCGLFG